MDGIVLIAPLIGDEMLSLLANLEIPVAIISNPAAGSIPHFNIDNAGGTRAAVEHLLSLGHRQIGNIAGRSDDGNSVERLLEFSRVMKEADLSVPDEFIAYGGFTREGGRRGALRMLSALCRPTAIVAGNDLMAYGLYDAARELGLRIPQDVSVVGFDDDEASALVNPPLTTVHQPIHEMAAAAFDAVVRLSEGETVQSQIFPANLVIRNSTSCPWEGAQSCNAEHYHRSKSSSKT